MDGDIFFFRTFASRRKPPFMRKTDRQTPIHPMMQVRKTAILFILSQLCTMVAAQPRRIQNKPFIDERRFHYGFFVGLHDQNMQLENNGYTDEETGKQWVAQTDQTNFGFSVGVLGEWRMGKYMALRTLPSLHFGGKHISFRELSTGETGQQDMKTCYIGVPVDLKLSAPRFNNYRPYVIAGVAPMFDLMTSKQQKLKTKPFSLMLEAGLGCDLYMPYFKFIPELKFCFGLSNVLKKNRPDLTDPSQMIFTQSVDKATIGMVVLSFYFE